MEEKIFENEENNKKKEYLLNLYRNLSIMYFHCFIAFPLVEIDFKKEENFNSEKMIDFINRGKNRKVNFVILPSLISNENYLQNGKSWVFTFSKNSFKFDDSINETLNNLLNKNQIDIKYIKDNLKVKVSYKIAENVKYVNIKINIDIPKEIEYTFVFHYIDKRVNNTFSQNIKQKNFEIEKYLDITKYEVKLENEIILCSEEIEIEK